MLDIKFLRENPDVVKQNIKNKFQDRKLPLVDEVIELDKENREIKQEVQALRADRNKLSKQIGALMGQGKKEEAEEVKKQVTASADRIEELSEREKVVEEKIKEIMMTIPNIIDPSVPIGKDDSENVELERFGEPVVPDFEVPYHTEIMESFDGIDLDSARKVAGNGFYYLMGDIARLHSAVIAYARDFMIDRGQRGDGEMHRVIGGVVAHAAFAVRKAYLDDFVIPLKKAVFNVKGKADAALARIAGISGEELLHIHDSAHDVGADDLTDVAVVHLKGNRLVEIGVAVHLVNHGIVRADKLPQTVMRLMVEINHLLDVHDVVLDEVHHVAAGLVLYIIVDGNVGVVLIPAPVFFPCQRVAEQAPVRDGSKVRVQLVEFRPRRLLPDIRF